MDYGDYPPDIGDYRLQTKIYTSYTLQSNAGWQLKWVLARTLGEGPFKSTVLHQEATSGALRAVRRVRKEYHGVSFKKQCQAIIAVHGHQEFVSFFGWYGDCDHYYLATEFLKNGNLGDYIQSNGCRAEFEAKKITAQILSGLLILHNTGMIHGNLKPQVRSPSQYVMQAKLFQNVLVSSVSPIRIKLADFGAPPTEERTKEEMVYIAPELRQPIVPGHLSNAISRYCDIWSLGCVICEIVAMQSPHIDTSSDNLDLSIRAAALPIEALRKYSVSQSSISFIKRLLAADPYRRPSVVDALRSNWFSEPSILDRDDCNIVIKHQFESLGQRMGFEAATELVSTCKQRRNVDLGPYLSPLLRSDDESFLYSALSKGYSLIVELVVKYWGININYRIKGLTLLQTASVLGHTDIVKFLLASGAKVDSDLPEPEIPKKSALHLAALHGHDNVVQILLEAGADANETDSEGQTVLHLAALHGYEKVVIILLEAGADVNKTGNEGQTVLQLAARHGHTAATNTLILAGANKNARDNSGRTALHYAVGYNGSISVLVDEGADINATDKNYRTALHTAAEGGYDLAVKALLSSKAHFTDLGTFLNAMDIDGRTALHLAAWNGHERVVELLLARGVDVESKDNYGQTALDAASVRRFQGVGSVDQQGCDNVIKLLAGVNSKSTVTANDINRIPVTEFFDNQLFNPKQYWAEMEHQVHRIEKDLPRETLLELQQKPMSHLWAMVDENQQVNRDMVLLEQLRRDHEMIKASGGITYEAGMGGVLRVGDKDEEDPADDYDYY